ncbi:hypothetical protein DXG01_008773 [Tephrocybe rancida]|nr:hypothetical protein DXG01_008773 [Tephrocybe rancida]
MTARDECTLEAQEAQYLRSEERRTDAFQTSLRHFQQEFQEEVEIQSAGERGREKDFDHAMARFKNVFVKNLMCQDERYNECNALHEETFQESDAAREAVFAQGQQDRADAFRVEEEARAKSTDWSTAARRTLLIGSRQRIQDTCASLAAFLTDQSALDKMLIRQEDDFLADERRRDEIARKNVSIQIPFYMTKPFVTFSIIELAETKDAPYAPLTTTLQPVLTQGAEFSVIATMSLSPRTRSTRSQSRNRSRSGSTSPDTSTPSLLPHVQNVSGDLETLAMPVPIVRHEPSIDSSFYSRQPSHHVMHAPFSGPLPEPEFKTADSNSLSKSEGSSCMYRNSTRLTEDVFSKRFMVTQHERQATFLQEEQEREHRFQAAEAEREEAEHARSKGFNLKLNDWLKRFQKQLESHDEHFRGREEARSERNRQRDATFELAQEQRYQRFDMSISYVKEQAELEEKYEDLLAERLKSMTSALWTRQENQINAIWTDRRARFDMAQQRRSLAPGLSASPVGMQYLQSCSQPEGSDENRQFDKSPRGFYMYRGAAPPVGMPIRSISPGIGFAPTALLRGGANLHEALPVVASENTDTVQLVELRQELTFVNLQRMHQAVFEKSEARREDLFEREIRRRRQIFKSSASKRGIEFVKAQRRRSETFEEAEDYCAAAFQEAQQGRERLFQGAERTRAADFQQCETARVAQFRTAQKERGRQFHAIQSELQIRCIQEDKQRLEKLERWGEELVVSRERNYEAEREYLERIFCRSQGSRGFQSTNIDVTNV